MTATPLTRYGVDPVAADWYFCATIDVDGETTYVDGYATGERPTVTTWRAATACPHTWVGGMIAIDPEDLATVVAMRGPDGVECGRCGVTYAERHRSGVTVLEFSAQRCP